MEHYFIKENETITGPFSLDAILDMNLSESTLVWKEGMKGWTQLNKLPELKKSIPPPIPKIEDPEKINIIEERVRLEENKEIISNGIAYDSEYDAEQNLIKHDNAGYILRVIAFWIDCAILVFLVSSFFILLPIPIYENNLYSSLLVVFNSLIFILFHWLYFALFECSKFQATPGKKILRLKVTNYSFTKIGFGQATRRFFGKILSALILGIGFIMIAFTKQKQGLHDKIAKTYVLEVKESDLTRTILSYIILFVSILIFVVSVIKPEIDKAVDNKNSILEKYNDTSTIKNTPALLNVSYGPVSFNYPDDWQVEKREAVKDYIFQINCLRNNSINYNLFSIIWVNDDSEPKEFIMNTIKEYYKSPNYKNINRKPFVSINFNGYEALTTNIDLSDKEGSTFFTKLISFKAKGRTYMISKVSDKLEKLNSDFNIIESSLKIE